MNLAGGLGLWWLLLLAAALVVYLWLLLPRLPNWLALGLGGLAGLVLLAMARPWSPEPDAGWLLAAVMVLAGQAGWWFGLRAGRPAAPAGHARRKAGAASRGKPTSTDGAGRRSARPAPDAASDAGKPRSSAGAASRTTNPQLPAERDALGRSSAQTAASQTIPNNPLAAPPVPAGRGSELPRSHLGRYRLERVLGRGAMGTVYLGMDPKIGRPVAIKTLDLGQEFEGEGLVEAQKRFFREAETAGRLQHRDIVTIFDAGEAGGLAYIAMELLPGHDLQRHTQAPRLLPVPTVLRIVVRVAEALAYAHSQGVVHRDVKPANVMVDLAGDGVKVTDFGIARITDASRTRTGMVMGTPSFMSPEQMAGGRLDGRADLYSLGVMLFQLLTGQLPHQADSMARLMSMIVNDPAPDVRSLRPELPEGLAAVVALAMEKRPALRYVDGLQMAADLRALDEPVAQQFAAEMTAAQLSTDAPPDPLVSADAFAATQRVAPGDTRHNPDT